MLKLELVSIARLIDFGLKPYLNSPYLISNRGRVTYSPRVRKLVYIFHVSLFIYMQLCLLLLFRPKDAFHNAYKILGYFRGFFQCFSLSCVVVWNIHFSRHVFNAISIIFALKKELPFNQKELRYTLATVIGELIYAYAILYMCLSYVFGRWGFSFDATQKYLLIFSEFNAFSGELTFINVLAMLNKFSGMLNKIMDTLKDDENVFDFVYIRNLIRAEDTKIGRQLKCDKINRIRILYGKIYDAKAELHTAFSFPLLVTTATAFGNLVFFVFVNTLTFKYGTNVAMENFVMSCMYPFVLFLKLCVIVTVCNTFKERVKAGKLASTKLFGIAVTEEETETVTGLVQELSHMNPEITCHGFAVIDYELISSMIGTIITYTVILLQTKFTEDGSDPVMSLLFDI